MTPSAAGEGPGGVPVLSADIGTSGPVHSHFEVWDEIREQCPAFWNEVEGGSHWVLTRFEAQREALQQRRDLLHRVDDRVRPEPGVHVAAVVPRPRIALEVPAAVQRPLLAGGGRAPHPDSSSGVSDDDREVPRPRALRLHRRVRRCLSDAGVPHRLGSSARGRSADGRLGSQDLPRPRRDRHRGGRRGQRRAVRLLRAVVGRSTAAIREIPTWTW